MLKKAPEAAVRQDFISAVFIIYFDTMIFQFIVGFLILTKFWLLVGSSFFPMLLQHI